MLSRLRGQTVNVVLALVAIALVVVVLVTRGRVTTDEREARENNLLSAYRETEIQKISIRRGNEEIVVERGSTDDAGEPNWRLRKPYDEDAEAYAINALLGTLEFATWIRRIKPEEVDRAAFGLDAPKWILQLQMGEIAYELRLGKEAPTPKGAHYLELVTTKAPGAGVGVISRDLATELGIDAAELRGRQLMPYLSDVLSTIIIEGHGGTRRFVSIGENRWRFDGMHGNARVNRDAFDAVLTQFARTKAEHFLPAPPAPGAPDTERVRITMIPKDASKPKGIVEVGGRCPKSENDVLAVRKAPDPIAACVASSVMPGLTSPAETLIDKNLYTLRKDEVESVVIVQGDKKLELDRTEAGFVLRSPVKADVELETGNQHLEAFVAARGKIIPNPDPKKLGLEPPHGRATLKSVAESEAKVIEETVELSAPHPTSGVIHVRRKADGTVLELDRDTARLISADATLLRKRRLVDFAPSQFLSADIKSKSLHQRIHREPSGAFRLELPKDFTHDAGVATTLLDVLGSLEADRWVASEDDNTFGLADPTLTARITLELNAKSDATTTHTLTVGSATSGGYFAKLETTPPIPGVFILPRRVIETLETPLLDRSVFMVLPDGADSVTLEHAGKKLTLEKRGGTTWTAVASAPGAVPAPAPGTAPGPAPGAAPEITPARIAQITETLASLRAEAALHIGPARADEGFTKPVLIVRVDPPGTDKPYTFKIGSGDSWQGTSIHYARRDGIDATYVIAKNKVRALLDAL